MCGQLHQTTPGSGVFSHQCAQLPPISRLISLSSAAKRAGSSRSKRSAASVSTLPRRNTVVMM